jgi:hypothetical protein
METRVACAFCNQGALWKVRLRSLDTESYLCDECDTIWKSYEHVGPKFGATVHYLQRWIGIDDYSDIEFIEIVPWPNVS